MRILDFLRSPAGRVTRVVVGTALVWAGATMNSLAGLVLMVLGFIPVVEGAIGVSLIDDVIAEIMRYRSTHGVHAPGDHHA